MNKVFLSGNLTRDPEVRYSQSGKAYARMGIAVRRPYSKDKEAVDFFNLIAWDKTAEFCGNYFRKGSRALIEGRLQTSSYENKDGVKISSVDIIVDNIEFAGSKPQSEDGDEGNSTRRSSSNSSYVDKFVNRREQAQSRRNNNYDDFGGEPIDPEDTPF